MTPQGPQRFDDRVREVSIEAGKVAVVDGNQVAFETLTALMQANGAAGYATGYEVDGELAEEIIKARGEPPPGTPGPVWICEIYGPAPDEESIMAAGKSEATWDYEVGPLQAMAAAVQQIVDFPIEFAELPADAGRIT